MKKIKTSLVGLFLAITIWFSYGFADNYFELSKNLDIFSTVLKELNTYYVDDTKPGELMKTAIDGMLNSLDPYTNYIPESRIEDYRLMTTGEYGGIGSLIRRDGDYVIISEPYEDFARSQRRQGIAPHSRQVWILQSHQVRTSKTLCP